MRLPDGESLLQKTLQRDRHLAGVEQLLTISHGDLYFRTLDDYRSLNAPSLTLDFILEPFARISATALQTFQRHGPETQLLRPTDALINNVPTFVSSVDNARAGRERLAGHIRRGTESGRNRLRQYRTR